MTTRHRSVLIQYQSKCFPLVVLVFVRIRAKGSPLPTQRGVGTGGSGGVPESQSETWVPVPAPQGCPRSINPTGQARLSIVGPQRCSSLGHWTDFLGDSLSWGVELVMGCWEEQSEAVQEDIGGQLPVDSLLASTFVWPCLLPSQHGLFCHLIKLNFSLLSWVCALYSLCMCVFGVWVQHTGVQTMGQRQLWVCGAAAEGMRVWVLVSACVRMWWQQMSSWWATWCIPSCP